MDKSIIGCLLYLVFGFCAVLAQSDTIRKLPDFNLTSVSVDETKSIERKDLIGKVWIVSFMFTRCSGPCPMNSARMQSLQRKLPQDVMLASFTVDPKNDQEAALRLYAKRFKANPKRWVFITAKDEESLIPLFKDTFHTAYKPNAQAPCGYETYHSPKFFLIDRQGNIRGEYLSGDPKELKRLEEEALQYVNNVRKDVEKGS